MGAPLKQGAAPAHASHGEEEEREASQHNARKFEKLLCSGLAWWCSIWKAAFFPEIDRVGVLASLYRSVASLLGIFSGEAPFHPGPAGSLNFGEAKRSKSDFFLEDELGKSHQSSAAALRRAGRGPCIGIFGSFWVSLLAFVAHF